MNYTKKYIIQKGTKASCIFPDGQRKDNHVTKDYLSFDDNDFTQCDLDNEEAYFVYSVYTIVVKFKDVEVQVEI